MSFALAVLAPLLLSPALPRKGIVELVDLVDRSTLVCIGRVEALIPVTLPGHLSDFDLEWIPGRSDSFKYARVRVERVLKGDPATATFYMESWPTWTCDSTRCEVGERSMFLVAPREAPAGMPPFVRAMIESALGSGTVYRNVGSGDGIIPIRGTPGEEFVYCSGAPDSLDMPGERYASRFSLVLDYVEGVARFRPSDLAVRALCQKTVELQKGTWSKPFDLRILPDGSRRLAIGHSRAGVVVIDKMPAAEWSALGNDLDALLGARHWSRPADGDGRLERELSIRTSRGSLVFRDPDPALLEPDVVEARTTALRAWSLVRASLDCADCTDQRADDLAWIHAR